jgi:hypothetical protein
LAIDDDDKSEGRLARADFMAILRVFGTLRRWRNDLQQRPNEDSRTVNKSDDAAEALVEGDPNEAD